jgi:hypothetical protein
MRRGGIALAVALSLQVAACGGGGETGAEPLAASEGSVHNAATPGAMTTTTAVGATTVVNAGTTSADSSAPATAAPATAAPATAAPATTTTATTTTLTPTAPTTTTTTLTPTAPTTTTTTVPTTTTGSTALASVGVNLEAVADYARLQPFADLMKSSRRWGSLATPWDGKAPVDASGWPTADAGVVVNMRNADVGDEQKSYRHLTPGTYRLQFTGKATVAAVASPNVRMANYAYDAATNRSQADVVVGTGAPQLMLTFTGTAGGVRDVSLRNTRYPATQTFSDEFIQALAPFSVVRMMAFLEANNNPVRTWAERTTPASASQAGPKGAAFEYAIQIANELGKDIWINIPYGVDDAFVRSLATLLKQTLSPQRKVYVEYSNELWNHMFKQTIANDQAAVAEAIAGDTTLTKGTQCTQAMFDATSGPCNAYWVGQYRLGKLTVQTAKIFSEVWGAAALNQQVRVVYATQFANPSIAEQVLKNIATYRAAPASLLYGVATAPYFYLSKEMAASLTATPDEMLQGMNESLVTTNLPFFKVGAKTQGTFVPGKAYTGGDYTGATHKALADYYGIKHLAYEGGPDMRQNAANTPAKIAANRDMRMGGLLESQLAQWLGCGNDLFMYFALSSKWGQYGYWGLTNDPTDLTGAKYQTVSEIARSPQSAFTTCK